MEVSESTSTVLGIVYSTRLTNEELVEIRRRFEKPFDPNLIKWKPQRTKMENGRPMGQAIAHADPRAYEDRLNEVVGPAGWFNNIDFKYSGELDKTSGWGDKKTTRRVMKITCTVSVGIVGVGFKSNIGESWADEDYASTAAYAQALKRACVPFGLGRYLYDLPDLWLQMDQYKKYFIEEPSLPDWAIPLPDCDDCGSEVVDTEHAGRLWSARMLLDKSFHQYGMNLCFQCQVKRKQNAGQSMPPGSEMNGAAERKTA